MTPEAVITGLTHDVRTVLLTSAITEAALIMPGNPWREGFTVRQMAAVGPERAMISWYYPDARPAVLAGEPAQELIQCADALREAGYETEYVTDDHGSYLAAWPKDLP